MKKELLLLSLVFSLFSCSNLSSITTSTDESISSSYNNRELFISSNPQKTIYNLYDKFDSTGLIIGYTAEGKEIAYLVNKDEYTLSINGKKIKDGDILKEVGTFLVTITYNGLTASFSISVNNVYDYYSELEIVSLPNKTKYQIGEHLDPTGLSLLVNTTYKTAQGQEVKLSETVTKYKLTINDIDFNEYTFNEPKREEVKITYIDNSERVIFTSFAIQVLKVKDIFSPFKYDDSIGLPIDHNNITITFDNPNFSDTNDKGYYAPEEIITAYNSHNYGEDNYYNWHYPSTSEAVAALVIPVVVPGYEEKADDYTWNCINQAFFGDDNDLYFESLRSYYYKSSFGQLDIQGAMTDYYYAKDESSFYHHEDDLSTEKVNTLAQDCLNWAIDTYSLDSTKYDLDRDGTVDMIWLVYVGKEATGGTYWAFTSSTGSISHIPDKSFCNMIGWIGASQIIGFSDENGDVDAHTIIHETGHIFGISDYYSTALNGYSDYMPLGRSDMMDQNVGDHNSYSKLTLGWTKPYIVYGDCTLTLSSSRLKDSCIVIPYDNKKYEKDENGKILFNPYDEYLVLELYTPIDLNSQGYDAYYVDLLKTTGVKVFHVDARLACLSNYTSTYIPEDPDWIYKEKNLGKPWMVITNTEQGETAEERFYLNQYNHFDEIRWITKDHIYLNRYQQATEDSLFKKGDFFSLTDYIEQFNADGLDNGEILSTTFEILK